MSGSQASPPAAAAGAANRSLHAKSRVSGRYLLEQFGHPRFHPAEGCNRPLVPSPLDPFWDLEKSGKLARSDLTRRPGMLHTLPHGMPVIPPRKLWVVGSVARILGMRCLREDVPRRRFKLLRTLFREETQATMKKLLTVLFAFVVAFSLTVPGMAQKGKGKAKTEEGVGEAKAGKAKADDGDSKAKKAKKGKKGKKGEEKGKATS